MYKLHICFLARVKTDGEKSTNKMCAFDSGKEKKLCKKNI